MGTSSRKDRPLPQTIDFCKKSKFKLQGNKPKFNIVLKKLIFFYFECPRAVVLKLFTAVKIIW
jgi:hypothetical protein